MSEGFSMKKLANKSLTANTDDPMANKMFIMFDLMQTCEMIHYGTVCFLISQVKALYNKFHFHKISTFAHLYGFGLLSAL